MKACNYLADKAFSAVSDVINHIADPTGHDQPAKASDVVETIRKKMSPESIPELSFSSELVDKLNHDYGLKLSVDELNKKFQDLVGKYEGDLVATNETWLNKLLPKDLKAFFQELINENLPKVAKEASTQEDFEKTVSLAINDIGDLVANFSEQLANYDDIDFFEKPLCTLPDTTETGLLKRKHLIDKKEIKRLQIAQTTIRFSDKNNELLHYIQNNLCTNLIIPDSANGSETLPYVFGEHPKEDEARQKDSAYHVRDAIKKNKSRGFFYKFFRRSRYKKEQLQIRAATELLKSYYDPVEIDKLLDLNDKSHDISKEERGKYGANKNANEIAKEIKEQIANEERERKSEQEIIKEREEGLKKFSQDTLEKIKDQEIEKYDNLFDFSQSIELPMEESEVNPQTVVNDSKEPAKEASPEMEKKEDSPEIEKKEASPEMEKKEASPEMEKKEDSPEIEKKEDSPEMEKKEDSPEMEKKEDSPEIGQEEQKSKEDVQKRPGGIFSGLINMATYAYQGAKYAVTTVATGTAYVVKTAATGTAYAVKAVATGTANAVTYAATGTANVAKTVVTGAVNAATTVVTGTANAAKTVATGVTNYIYNSIGLVSYTERL